jgi:undecaprenyl-diphosphatase
MIEFLKNIDEALFLFLNGIHNNIVDFFIYWITKKETWYPIYAIIFIWMTWKYKRRAIIPIIIVIVAITISDQFTSSFMKTFFERLRPCHEPTISHLVHIVDGCGGQFGFASSHASNSFTLTTLLYLFFKPNLRYTLILFIWAVLVSYSRVYVGVHYPGDVIVGGIIGYLIAVILFFLYSKLPSEYKLVE